MVETGTVENVNDNPPFDAVKTEADAVDETLKSLVNPTVAPVIPDTEIVHKMLDPTRDGFVPLQDRDDAVVGGL